MASQGTKFLLLVLGITGGIAGLAYLANRAAPGTKNTAHIGASGFPSSTPNWSNDEHTDIVRDQRGFIKEINVKREVRSD